MENQKLTVVDLFCGAGGFSEGFRQAGFQIIKGYDNWSPAIQTFNHNFSTSSEVVDILSFNDSVDEISKIPDTDVIIGSPPCVSFSSSNNSGKGNKDTGLLLIKTFLRIIAVKKYQPNSVLKAWFMENVPNSKKYLSQEYNFSDLNLADWAAKQGLDPNMPAIKLAGNQPNINAADYGSFQSRVRVISGEIIKLKKLVVPESSHAENDSDKTPWRTLGELLNIVPSPNSRNEPDISITDPVYPSIQIMMSELTDQFYDSGLYEAEWRQTKHQKTNHPYMGKMSFPENLEKPSRTLVATRSITSRESFIYKSEWNRDGDGEYRIPTIREAASIMGFPYTYQFLGALNTKWRLVGNAVCPAVSRAFAFEVLRALNIPIPTQLILNTKPNMAGVQNLNNFSEKEFSKPPLRVKNSRFRMHPIKDGNMTVTLSNYDISKNANSEGVWRTSIQYGSGAGFPIQHIEDNFYHEIEALIRKFENGEMFIDKVNNGFSEKIGSSRQLQEMYEKRESEASFLEPTRLIAEVVKLIREYESSEVVQNPDKIFIHKKKIPATQLLALYAINKISTIANGGSYGSADQN